MSGFLIESRLSHARRSVWSAIGAHVAFNSLVWLPTQMLQNILNALLFVHVTDLQQATSRLGARVAAVPVLKLQVAYLTLWAAVWVFNRWLIHRFLLDKQTGLLRERRVRDNSDLSSEQVMSVKARRAG